jgi:hypothetical protein
VNLLSTGPISDRAGTNDTRVEGAKEGAL